MNIQFLGKLHLTDNNGDPAAGYKIWTYAPGSTTTPGVTYIDPACTVANTSPAVVLDERGEASIYINTATDFYYTDPTATDVSSPIWGPITAGQQQGIPPIPSTIVGTTTHNQYKVTCSPIALAIADLQEITFKPDVDSVDTLVTPPGASSPTVFTGTGINDCYFSGPYVGTTSGSVFQVEVIAVVVQPPGAPTLAAGAAGLVNNGNHYVLVTFVTPEGETIAGTPSAVINISANDKIELSDIPLGPTGQNVTDRNIYMTKAGGSTYYLVGAVGDNTTTTYEINLADSSLPTTQPPTTNATGDGSGSDKVQWRKDGGSWTPASITELVQTTIEGISFKFSVKSGHTVGDIWAVTVELPVTIDFCSLTPGWIVYKIVDSVLTALGKGDVKAGYPFKASASTDQSAWIIPGASLPSGTTTIQNVPRPRKEIYADYDVTAGDENFLLSCNADLTLNLPVANSVANYFFYFMSKATYTVTIKAHGTELIFGPGSPAGNNTFTLNPGLNVVQLQCNGDDWRVLTVAVPRRGHVLYTHADDGTYWTCPDGITTIKVTIIPPGGGGSGTGDNTATYFGAGGGPGRAQVAYVTTVPQTQYLLTIPDGAGGGSANGTTPGASGATASLGALLSATGGQGATAGTGVANGAPGVGIGTGDDGLTGPSARGGRQFIGQALGNFGNGGAASANYGDTGKQGQAACILIEY